MAPKCDVKKHSFTNQVVKDKIVFPLFVVKSNGFEFKCSIDFRFSFFLRFEVFNYKKVDANPYFWLSGRKTYLFNQFLNTLKTKHVCFAQFSRQKPCKLRILTSVFAHR